MPRRGENIYKRKDGRREGRFKPDSSSQKYKSVYAPTYKLAKEKLIELKMNKLFESDKIILMCELCKEWLEFKKEVKSRRKPLKQRVSVGFLRFYNSTKMWGCFLFYPTVITKYC